VPSRRDAASDETSGGRAAAGPGRRRRGRERPRDGRSRAPGPLSAGGVGTKARGRTPRSAIHRLPTAIGAFGHSLSATRCQRRRGGRWARRGRRALVCGPQVATVHPRTPAETTVTIGLRLRTWLLPPSLSDRRRPGLQFFGREGLQALRHVGSAGARRGRASRRTVPRRRWTSHPSGSAAGASRRRPTARQTARAWRSTQSRPSREAYAAESCRGR